MPEQAEAPVYHTPTDRAHDPREHEEWFLRLPEHGKQEMRRLWRNQEGHTPERRERRLGFLRSEYDRGKDDSEAA